jgi:dihydrolipoamide dehydrogenase
MKFDLIVIGSGPGGYIAAIRASQLGMKTAIIERYANLGGTCLNVGCIPSKALLDSTEHYHQAVTNFETHGINVTDVQVDMKQMIARKNDVVEQVVGGVEFLMKKNSIEVFYGHASFIGPKKISVKSEKGEDREIEGEKIIIATGSKPIVPEAFNYDKKRVITSTEALNIEKVPKKMVLVGGGVIGLELGSVFARLGTEVTVVEYTDGILPGMDRDCARVLQRSLKKLGVKFHLKHMVTEVKPTSRSVTVMIQKRDTDETFELKADYCLVAIGRRPYTEGLGLEHTTIKVDEKGRIITNDHLETDEPGVFAIGDVIKGAMLAHKAEEEGVFAAEYIAGQRPHIHYHLIPGVVYTWPELASVGHTEEQLKEMGTPFKVGKFPMRALGRARASMDTDGLIKVIAHKDTDEVLGVHMVGPRVADLIAEAVAVMEYRGSAEDISRMSHAHPTYAEAVKEAALDATGSRPLNA